MPRFTIHRKDNNQDEIREVLEKRGFQVILLGDPWDFVVAKNGKMKFVDVKDPKKEGWESEFTSKQKKFLKDWQGSPVEILRSIDDCLRFEL